jgi:glyoxylate/hydroxypyruvate reductase A
MRILIAIATDDRARWHAAFAKALPEATIETDAPTRALDVDYLIAWRPPPATFERARIRKAIFNVGAGVDALLATPGLPRDVPIFRLEDAGMAQPMAEYVAAAVLRAYRELDRYDAAQRERRWEVRRPLDKSSYVIGVLGLGVLGAAVARTLVTLGFPVAGYARTTKPLQGVRVFAGDAELHPFLSSLRVLVCLLPSTQRTRGLLDRATLAALPRGADVINVARGDLVVEADLLALLDEGHLAHATLDVFAEEPLPSTHPFWHHPRVTLTPHISALTRIDESVAQVAASIRVIERGDLPAGRVDVDRGY